VHYTAYRRSIDAAAAAILDGFPSQRGRVRVVSLAGGFYGIEWPLVDGQGSVILARDLDGHGEWVAWCEDDGGDRWTDDAYGIGHVRPRDYALVLASGAAQCLGAQSAASGRKLPTRA
jgi:hypothetical protein